MFRKPLRRRLPPSSCAARGKGRDITLAGIGCGGLAGDSVLRTAFMRPVALAAALAAPALLAVGVGFGSRPIGAGILGTRLDAVVLEPVIVGFRDVVG